MAEPSPSGPLYRYLDDERALAPGLLLLSTRELVERAYSDLPPHEQAEFQRQLCSRLGDPVRTIAERTRLIEMVPAVSPERQTRRLARRQIIDDVRELFRAAAVPSGANGLDYVRRLRCLLEIGGLESPRFWRFAYQACGTSCSLVVFTALHARQPDAAIEWLTTYLSPWEQVRVLEKALPLVRQTGDSGPLEDLARDARAAVSRPPEEAKDWREVLILLIHGRLNIEQNRTGTMEFLRSAASHVSFPDIERQEVHLRSAIERLFEDWAAATIKLDIKSALRLFTLTRESQSAAVLSAMVTYLEFLDASAAEPDAATYMHFDLIGASILDCLAWFDGVIEALGRPSRDQSAPMSHELHNRVLAVLRRLRSRPGLADRAARELVRHAVTDGERARALVEMLSHGSPDVTDWVEDLDHRMAGHFQILVSLALQEYRLQAHLRDRLAALARWCDEAYTIRDRLIGGSGWAVEPYSGAPLRAILEAREDEDFDELMQSIAALDTAEL